MDKNNDSFAVYRKEAFDIGYKDYFKNVSNNRISQILNDRERNIKLQTITRKQIYDWKKEGLITVNENNGWRKLSIIDALILKLISELREFGMSWNIIKIVRESLEFEKNKYGVAMPILEFYTAFALGNKMPVLLLVFKDGICVPTNYTQYKVAREFSEVENHIQINLNKILQDFFPAVDLKPVQKAELPVEMDEMELLAFLRLGSYEKIEIKYSKGKMETILGTERFANDKVFDAVKKKEYSEIIVRKNDDGIVTSLIAKRRKKL